MAYVALTKRNALTLITAALRNAREQLAKADKDYVVGPLLYRKKFFGLLGTPYCSKHGDRAVRESAWGDCCAVCLDMVSVVRKIESALDALGDLELLAGEAEDNRSSADVFFDAKEIDLLRQWAPRYG